MQLGLTDRVAVVTGASKGIGKAIARSLAAEGMRIVMLARTSEALERAAEDIRQEHPVKILTLATDITDGAWVARTIAAISVHPDYGRIHLLVNNAGSPIKRQDRQILWPDEDWRDDLEIKMIGYLRMIRDCLPLMPNDGSASIINITGAAGMNAWSPALTHGLNNSALNHGTGYLAQDLAAENIRVNAVVPGLIATEWREYWADNSAVQAGITREQFLEGYCRDKGIISRRWAKLEEVADVVTFLASDRAAYINAAKIVVDGGIHVNPR